MMTRVAHKRRGCTSTHGPCTGRVLSSKQRDSRLVQRVSNIIGPRPQDSQACHAMRLLSRVFRSTGEMEQGEGVLRCNQRFNVSLLGEPKSMVFPLWWCARASLSERSHDPVPSRSITLLDPSLAIDTRVRLSQPTGDSTGTSSGEPVYCLCIGHAFSSSFINLS